MTATGNRIGDRPYLYGGDHPDFLHAAGLLGTAALVSGQFQTWGEPGPGRWITIYANADHVWTLVAGLRNDTGRYDDGPNIDESGPRWRIGTRPDQDFVIRHPNGY